MTAGHALAKLNALVIARLTGEFEVIVVNAASPLKSMQDLVAMFKADPGKVSWAGGSAGGTDHILAGLIAKAVGVDAKRVSYVAYAGGGPAQAALLGNQVTCGISGLGEFGEQIRSGRLRALAVSAGEPQEGIPTLALPGVWSWKQKLHGKSFAIPDLDRVVWKGRKAVVVFDSDLAEKPTVAWAEHALVCELHTRGAEVFILRLPDGPKGAKVGLAHVIGLGSACGIHILEKAAA